MVKFNLKKKIAKALVFAMVMGTVGIHGAVGSPVATVQADDETPTPVPPTVTIDYENFTATIERGNNGNTPWTDYDRYVFLEVLKSDGDNPKVSATYCYPVGTIETDDSNILGGIRGVIVDLSFLKISKDQYIRVYGDRSTSTKPITINAQDKKPSIKYDVAKGKLVDKTGTEITVGTTGTGAVAAVYEWKSLYGSNWQDLMNDSLDGLNIAGTTILLRQKAVPQVNGEGGKVAGPEVKVKIAAIPKAPKIKVDYAKGTVTIPKDSEVAILKDDDFSAIAEDGWNKYTAAKTYSSLEELAQEYGLIEEKTSLGETITTDQTEIGYILVVRSTKTGKPNSAPAFVDIGPVATLDDPANGEIKQGSVVVATYESTTKGVKLTAGDSEIQYSTDEGKKWTSIKAKANKEVKISNGDTILVRIAGIKGKTTDECKFPSKAVELTCYTAPAKIKLETTGKATVDLPLKSSESADITITVTVLDGNGTDITDNYVESGIIDIVKSDVKFELSSLAGVTFGGGAVNNKGLITATVTVANSATAGKATLTVSIGEVNNKVEITVNKAETEE